MDLEAVSLFCERFPRYALFLPEWTPAPGFPPLPGWEAAVPLDQTEVLYLYGLAPPPEPIRAWLAEKKQRRLIFLEPSTGVIASFLQEPAALPLLQQEQIELYHLPQGRAQSALVQELVERFPARGIQIASPSGREAKRFARLKLQILRKSALTHASYVERLYCHIPLGNLLKNLSHLPRAFYANRMKDAFKDVPAVLCGAGPSLQSSLDTLRTLENRALIFAGGSAIAALTANGIEPHFAVAIDPNQDEFKRMQNSFAFQTPFLFSTRLHPESLALCNGPLGYIRSGMSGLVELWFEEQLGLTEPLLSEELPAESLSVTTLCVALAHHFGCNPIVFDGLDLAYTDGRRYAAGVNAESEKKVHLQPVDRLLQKRDRHGKAVTSAVRWVMESQALAKFARRAKTRRFINCTQGGLSLSGVPFQPIDAIEWGPAQDLRGRVHAAIQRVPLPNTSILPEKIAELQSSLDCVAAHIDTLIRSENFGRVALAEMELKEELAYALLLFDAEKTLRAALGHNWQQSPDERAAYWKALQELVANCQKMARDIFP